MYWFALPATGQTFTAILHRVVMRRGRRLADDRTTVLGAIGFHGAVNLEV